MKRYRERSKAELLVEAKFFEAEEIFTDVLCEISAEELLATVVECASSIGTDGIWIKCRALVLLIDDLRRGDWENLQVAQPSEPSYVRASQQAWCLGVPYHP
jgi:hypothetical protein